MGNSIMCCSSSTADPILAHQYRRKRLTDGNRMRKSMGTSPTRVLDIANIEEFFSIQTEDRLKYV